MGAAETFFESSLCVRKSMLGHIFRTESEAKHSGPRKKDGERKSRELARRGRQPFKPQTVLLSPEASAGGNQSGEARHFTGVVLGEPGYA